MKIEVGKTYLIEHSRKGPFVAKILGDHGEFIEVEVVKGRADFISAMNVVEAHPVMFSRLGKASAHSEK